MSTPFSTRSPAADSGKLEVGVHVILGLKGESHDDMRATARLLAGLGIRSVKLHNLYAVHGTRLAENGGGGRSRNYSLWMSTPRVLSILSSSCRRTA